MPVIAGVPPKSIFFPRQKAGSMQTDEVHTANPSEQALQDMQAVGLMGSPGLNSQLRANGRLMYGQQRLTPGQIRQQLSQQAAVTSPQKLEGQNLQSLPSLATINSQLSSLSLKGQSTLMPGTISQQCLKQMPSGMPSPVSPSYHTRPQQQRQLPQQLSSQLHQKSSGLSQQQIPQLVHQADFGTQHQRQAQLLQQQQQLQQHQALVGARVQLLQQQLQQNQAQLGIQRQHQAQLLRQQQHLQQQQAQLGTQHQHQALLLQLQQQLQQHQAQLDTQHQHQLQHHAQLLQRLHQHQAQLLRQQQQLQQLQAQLGTQHQHQAQLLRQQQQLQQLHQLNQQQQQQSRRMPGLAVSKPLTGLQSN